MLSVLTELKLKSGLEARRLSGPFLKRESHLGEFGPITLLQPNLLRRVVVVGKIRGRRNIAHVGYLELFIM